MILFQKYVATFPMSSLLLRYEKTEENLSVTYVTVDLLTTTMAALLWIFTTNYNNNLKMTSVLNLHLVSRKNSPM